MPKIAFASTKGGVGKSTVAVNLLAELAGRGFEVVLIEVDHQASATKWNRIRQLYIERGEDLPGIYALTADGEALSDVAQQKSDNGAFVIMDSPGVDSKVTRTALAHADVILTPTAPTAFDVWEVEPVIRLARELGRIQRRQLPVFVLFNQVPTNVRSTAVDETKAFMTENAIFPEHIFDVVVKHRASYQHAVKEGRGVGEYSPKDSSARREISQLTDELLAKLDALGKTKTFEGV